jgi:hypothetical protein
MSYYKQLQTHNDRNKLCTVNKLLISQEHIEIKPVFVLVGRKRKTLNRLSILLLNFVILKGTSVNSFRIE